MRCSLLRRAGVSGSAYTFPLFHLHTFLSQITRGELGSCCWETGNQSPAGLCCRDGTTIQLYVVLINIAGVFEEQTVRR